MDSVARGKRLGLVQFSSVSFILPCFVVCFCAPFTLPTHFISDIVACLEFVYEKPLV